MANFKTSLLALVGKGAQKRNVEKYARSVKKAPCQRNGISD